MKSGLVAVMPPPWHNGTMARTKGGDFSAIARRVVEQAIGEKLTGEPLEKEPEKNPYAVALGRLGGQKGGIARSVKLSARRRKEIAKRAAITRWKRKPTV